LLTLGVNEAHFDKSLYQTMQDQKVFVGRTIGKTPKFMWKILEVHENMKKAAFRPNPEKWIEHQLFHYFRLK
jgi:hypothetical protein